MNLVVAISSYKSDADALRLVTELHDGDYEFSRAIVVCSDGGRELSSAVKDAGYDNCEVLAFDTNLGSAGNLYERFKAAAAHGGEFMLALNHDAKVTPEMFRALVAQAQKPHDRIGAFYPLRYTPGKRQYDLTGVGGFPFKFRGSTQLPESEVIDVQWSSSNGALYALAPFREGIVPDASLWMGWEDYLYGLQLQDAGYRQCIVTGACATDDYEYKTVTWFGRKITLSDKPLWYCYYGPRNLALVCLHRRRSPTMAFDLLRWALWFPAQILLSRTGAARWGGLGYYLTGLAHGVLNTSGKWRLP